MDTLKKIDQLQDRGIRVTIDWINQIENGNAEHVAAGRLPYWTCTATAWQYGNVVNAISADSITEALEGIVKLLTDEIEG